MTPLTATAPRPRRALGAPVLITVEGTSALLAKIGLDSTSYNEAWLQKLAFAHPQLLPVSDIEPGFGELIPVAMEVPCGHGYLDNLYITPSGDIVLVDPSHRRAKLSGHNLGSVGQQRLRDGTAANAECRF